MSGNPPHAKRTYEWLGDARTAAAEANRKKRGKNDTLLSFDNPSQPPSSSYEHLLREYNVRGDSMDSQTYSISINGTPALLESFATWYTQIYQESINVSFDAPPEDDDPFIGQIDQEDITVTLSSRDPRPSDEPFKLWQDYMDFFLDELIHLEGRGSFTGVDHCVKCLSDADESLYRCRDCFTDQLLCKACLLTAHQHLPFHRIEAWALKEQFFRRTTLKELGLRVQLGHPFHSSCPFPERIRSDTFVVIDSSGIHEISLDFCGCGIAGPDEHLKQLLQARLFPATVQSPMTAVTFDVLNRYLLLSYELKTSAYQYYRSLVCLTNNIDEGLVKARYREWLRVVRQYLFLLMLKRAGRGHDPTGVFGTLEGELALLCPACPQEGWNLAEDWHNCPEDVRWLYTLFLAMDANFRLRRNLVSSEAKDPALCKGYGYFVDHEPYMAHLTKYGGEKQPRSQCVSHDAVNSADTKDVQGCSISGVGAVDCARHEFWRPNSIGDLQKGERYLNMDYLVWSSLKNASFDRIVAGYDIGCQYEVNFPARMSQKFPSDSLVNRPDLDLTFLIPKFHLPAHIEKCQREYSFNLTKHVGRTDGEATERNWSRVNDLAPSTRKMGPGSRRDKLEGFMADSNWKGTKRMDVLLGNRWDNATTEWKSQASVLAQLELILDDETVAQWRSEVEDWERDPSQPNPYKSRVKDLTQADVRLLLARQDAERPDEQGVAVTSGITGSSMIYMGIELEDLQRRLKDDLAQVGLHPTSLQQAKNQEWVNALRRRIMDWYSVQALYIPGTTVLRTLDEHRRPSNAAEPKVYDLPLWLPSAIGSRTDCDSHLQECEWIIRKAQAKDALVTIRSHLCLESYLVKKKKDWDRGVSANTRSRTLVGRNHLKLTAAVNKYRAAYEALQQLAPLRATPDPELAFLRELKDADVLPLSAAQAIGEGYTTLPWIWLAEGVADAGNTPDSPQLQDALRIQWLRARARVMQWEEKILLLQEEMGRVLAFVEARAAWWEQRASLRTVESSALQEGLAAYAHSQAWVYRDLGRRFSAKWRDIIDNPGAASAAPDNDGGDDAAEELASPGN